MVSTTLYFGFKPDIHAIIAAIVAFLSQMSKETNHVNEDEAHPGYGPNGGYLGGVIAFFPSLSTRYL